MTNHLNQMFQKVFENFESLTENPESFLKPSPGQNANFKNVAKTIYDALVQANSLTNLKTQALPKLLIEGFDEEQVWQQIELQNKNAISYLDASSNIDTTSLQLGASTNGRLKKSGNLSHDETSAGSEDEAMEEDEPNLDEESDLDDDDSDEYIDFDKPPPKDKTDEIDSENEPSKSSPKKKYKSQVDDKFFKHAKLEQFLRIEDLKEERSFDVAKGDDDLSSEEEINLFEDIPSEDEDSEEELETTNAQKKSSKDLMYKDFFDAPDSDNESSAKSNEVTDNEDENVDADEEEAESDADSSDDGDISKNTFQNKTGFGNASQNKTAFQLQLEKTKEEIARFEKGLLEPAPWHLTGEVDAINRPKDALLDLETDFDVNARPVIIEDKPLCEKLENMLKMTIKNKAYSDGVRQYKTNTELIAEKRETIIEEKKSSKSLAQEYEDMYLKEKNKPEKEENPKHVAIKKLRDSLFPELHALFSHIPKPAVPDIKIVSNLPAISVEEVAPTSVSDVTLLAPEEVKKRSGLVKGVTERNSTDKKRERRKKKEFQKMKFKKTRKKC